MIHGYDFDILSFIIFLVTSQKAIPKYIVLPFASPLSQTLEFCWNTNLGKNFPTLP